MHAGDATQPWPERLEFLRPTRFSGRTAPGSVWKATRVPLFVRTVGIMLPLSEVKRLLETRGQRARLRERCARR